jgi:hypothetical protein
MAGWPAGRHCHGTIFGKLSDIDQNSVKQNKRRRKRSYSVMLKEVEGRFSISNPTCRQLQAALFSFICIGNMLHQLASHGHPPFCRLDLLLSEIQDLYANEVKGFWEI